MKKLLLSTFVGAISYYLVGWLVFEYVLGEFMNNNTTQIPGFKKSEQEVSLIFLFISCLAYALMLSFVMWKWTQIVTFKEGMILGSVTGILIAIMTDSYWFSTSYFFNDFTPVLADIIAAAFTVGVMGGVIGWILGREIKVQ